MDIWRRTKEGFFRKSKDYQRYNSEIKFLFLHSVKGRLSMGKQINYYMEYKSFLLLAQKAIEIGCIILKEDLQKGIVIESDSIDIISEDCKLYHFYIPEVGKYSVEMIGNKERIDCGYSTSGITMIEASLSTILQGQKEITRGRLYCVSDYYDEEGNLIKRSDLVTKKYNTLVRYVKKIAPYTEVEHYVLNPRYAGKKLISKEYITDECLSFIQKEGFKI